MGLLHFHFSFFLGGPDGLQERFSVILVALWEPLGAILGPSWLHIGSNLAILAPSWCPLGPILAHLWPSWCHLGSIFAPTWPSWLHLGALLGSVRLLLGASWLI